MNQRPDGQREMNGGSDPVNPAPQDGVHVSEDVLNAYLDGELSGVERVGVREHLDTCSDCREHLAELRATVMMLRALPMPAPRRSFQLGPEHERSGGSIWQRLAAFLLPSLPALRAATIAVALLLAAVSIRNALVEPENRGPIADTPSTSQAAFVGPAETSQSQRNSAAVITNQPAITATSGQPGSDDAAMKSAAASDATEAALNGAGDSAPAPESAMQVQGGDVSESETTSAESSAPPSGEQEDSDNTVMSAPAESDTDAVADEQTGAEPSAQEPISLEADDGAAEDAPADQANVAMAAVAQESPVASPLPATPEATPSPTATATPAATVTPAAVAIPPSATASSSGTDGWRIAQLILGAALIAMIAILALLRRSRATR